MRGKKNSHLVSNRTALGLPRYKASARAHKSEFVIDLSQTIDYKIEFKIDRTLKGATLAIVPIVDGNNEFGLGHEFKLNNKVIALVLELLENPRKRIIEIGDCELDISFSETKQEWFFGWASPDGQSMHGDDIEISKVKEQLTKALTIDIF